MRILSRKAASNLVSREPGRLNGVLIFEPGNKHEIDEIASGCKGSCPVAFNDVVNEETEGAPTLEDVRGVLNWAVVNEVDFVACRQGVSRSSALAFLIEAQRVGPEEACLVLDPKIHYPNELVLWHGVKIIGEYLVPFVMDFYVGVARSRGWRYDLVSKYFR